MRKNTNFSHSCPVRPPLLATVIPVAPNIHSESTSPAPSTPINNPDETAQNTHVVPDKHDSSSSIPTTPRSHVETPAQLDVESERDATRPASPQPLPSDILDWLIGLFRRKEHASTNAWRDASESRRGSLFQGSDKTDGFLSRFSSSNRTQNRISQQSGVDDRSHSLIDDNEDLRDQPGNDSLKPDNETRRQAEPSTSTWRDWKKVSIDLYFRLTDNPRNSRLRLKQTLALLPIFKLKPIIDLSYRGPNTTPIAMRLDVKLIDCVKYMVRADGDSVLQVRAKAPLSDPRFIMDVTYERNLASSVDTVKISFRAMDLAFLKAPGLGFGFKYPVRFDNGIKVTIGAKKYLGRTANAPHQVNRAVRHTQEKGQLSSRKGRQSARSSESPYQTARKTLFHLHGPTAIDVKIRCLEYR
ncbi:hypothetical protein BWQ96_06348 [Gracilariopsis chorda]|uniref:Uncharacterized protein n=1 Tax=Gracilariopsis chorda TaxID=448386 RepID=A0A2V3IP82_9FLOR|nr:hypothetical protein BWQ96_06348 [Gracilariopsis chorda]|eukprot:PXF43882.1 hypothetical protein BWQ96_06348 [Gracilariopsis chorda]